MKKLLFSAVFSLMALGAFASEPVLKTDLSLQNVTEEAPEDAFCYVSVGGNTGWCIGCDCIALAEAIK